jgi:hypothetical protein
MLTVVLCLLLISLATFAVTYELRYTDGPFDAFWNLRRAFGIQVQLDDKQESEEYADSGTGFFGSLMVCWWCLSTWVSAFWTGIAVVLLGLSILYAPFVWFGAVTISGMIKRYIDGKIH